MTCWLFKFNIEVAIATFFEDCSLRLDDICFFGH